MEHSGCVISMGSFWRPRLSEGAGRDTHGTDHNDLLCQTATRPSAGDFGLRLPSKQHRATETTTQTLRGVLHPAGLHWVLGSEALAGGRLATMDLCSQQQPPKGLYSIAVVTKPFLGILTALLPCLLLLFRYITLPPNFRSSVLSSAKSQPQEVLKQTHSKKVALC